MLLQIRDLGPIGNATLDLRRLTVIIGANNTGKTYIAYAVYGLWKAILHSYRLNWYSDDVLGLSEEQLREARTHIHKMAFVEGVRRFNRNVGEYFQEPRAFKKARVHFEDPSAAIAELASAEKYSQSVAHFDEDLEQSVLLMDDSSSEIEAARRARRLEFYQAVRIEFAGGACVLPAERNGLILTYKILANRRLKLLRDTVRFMRPTQRRGSREDLLREQGELLYPEPMEDFLEMLGDIETEGKSADMEFTGLADSLEAAIFCGQHVQWDQTRLGGHELRLKVKPRVDIALHSASTSVKQMAALLLYLRHRAAKNDLLVMDEPELNLHPLGQAKVLEAIAILVNSGVRVVLTTHSPYVLAHLNNLIAGSREASIRTRQAAELYLKDGRAFLDPNDVGAYELADGNLNSLKDEDFGIRWDTLSDPAVELQQRWFAIRDAGNAG